MFMHKIHFTYPIILMAKCITAIQYAKYQNNWAIEKYVKAAEKLELKFSFRRIISLGQRKKDVTPLLTHWSYVFLALTHCYRIYPRTPHTPIFSFKNISLDVSSALSLGRHSSTTSADTTSKMATCGNRHFPTPVDLNESGRLIFHSMDVQ